MDKFDLLLYSANFAFILTNLYGFLLKWFYKPKAYANSFERLYPAQRLVGMLYLLQIFQLPYLFNIGVPDALLYVNAFSALMFPSLMLVMCENYFFPENVHHKREYLLFLPAFLALFPLLLNAIGTISLPESFRPCLIGIVSVVFIYYFYRSLRMSGKIGLAIRLINEAEYSDDRDFPLRFAQYIQWLPVTISLLMAINFWADNVWVKFAWDVLFTVVNVWFVFFTLNPWRKPIFTEEEKDIIERKAKSNGTAFRLSDKKYEEICLQLHHQLEVEKIYLSPHLTMEELLKPLSSNRNYLSEAIARLGYKSFYDMINHYRVNHAIEMIQENSGMKMIAIAFECGFSSPAAMTKAFKQQGFPSPTSYKTK
ncbi:helix-turn-helix domain-containing protein [Bacteroides helcogenes]|uniref:Helix-turn-helix-domain containing protein AraC type n=1 Tax=Bacteroides helcogenes (strain ATCC 35417 / DSM 20613 / JCM 6297 / CCUG 15421 / P 36-108) TaxID=693979 RepID=E6SQW1_BACT6|nr:helix-turn-helix domain-containing protein [Bacteroides helcogenes]ADV45030.1 helix-turn-helix- domain containing protein AraC type [Bacteroides helcogenes P 36-108]MDY5239888.1 helix-turn-helix domain-containing protein [Bacteroides helcogenes]